MQIVDYIVVGAVLGSLLIVGFTLSRISGKDTTEYLIAGRKMPWWLIGLSDLAVGLNTSNMLQDSRKVRQDGVIGLMHTWGFALKLCVANVFFSRLWRRARFKTQMEFYQARYTGWQANFARIYDTVIYGGFVTSVWAAVGLVGLKKVAITVMGLPPTMTMAGFTIPMDAVVVVGAVLIAMTYSAASGARGIYWTDLIEFLIAMIAIYALFFILFIDIGGSTGLRARIDAMPPAQSYRYLNFLQPFSIVYIGLFFINPFFDHGGFDPSMQRRLSLKDEREVLYTMLFSGVTGFTLRGLPFIAIGLIGISYINDDYLLAHFAPLFTPAGEAIPDWERVFPVLVQQFLPVGLTGLMTAAFICSFMSSFDSNIHLTGSVFINDLYRPYIVKDKSEKHYVVATQIVMILASLATIVIGIVADDLLYLGFLAITISLGAGQIKLLRLIWWRVNGAAEVAAQICALIVISIILSPLGTKIVVGLFSVLGVRTAQGVVMNDAFIVTRNLTASFFSTLAGLTAIALTRPEPMAKLCSFYRRMRPFGFWGPVRRELGGTVKSPDPIRIQLALVLSSIALIWGTYFSGIAALLAMWRLLGVSLLLAVVGGYGSYLFIRRLYPPHQEIEEYEDESERNTAPAD